MPPLHLGITGLGHEQDQHNRPNDGSNDGEGGRPEANLTRERPVLVVVPVEKVGAVANDVLSLLANPLLVATYDGVPSVAIPAAALPELGLVQNIRKASLFFGRRREKRLRRISPPQNGGIGGTMALL